MDEIIFESIIAVLIIGVVGCSGIMYVMYARIKQLVAELRVIKSRVDITDEELTRLGDDIAEFKKLKF